MSLLEFPVRFENPTYGLVAIVLAVAAAALFYLSFKRLRIAEKRLELVEWKKLRRIVRLFNVSTKASVVLALGFMLATPYFPTTIEVLVEEATEEQMEQYAITAVLLMDISYSMNISDLKPSRFDAAKTMMKLLLEKVGSKDLVGFIPFAGQTYESVLPTTNKTKIAETIDSQTLHNSTAIGTAVETAVGVLEDSLGGKAIVLFSDGKNNAGIKVDSAVDQAVARDIPIFTVSVGTYGLGEADSLALREISDRTGGKFYEVRNEDIDNLATSISQISREVKVGALKAVYNTLIIPVKDYQTPRGVFAALLVVALLLSWFTGV